jgi:hypothetical protein
LRSPDAAVEALRTACYGPALVVGVYRRTKPGVYRGTKPGGKPLVRGHILLRGWQAPESVVAPLRALKGRRGVRRLPPAAKA